MLFFVFRVLVRLKVFRRLHADDALVLFACIMLFINTVLWQSDVDDLYENIAVSAGQLFPPPTELPHNTERYLRRSIVVIVLFYTGLWSVKLSFLIFFKRLGHNVRHQSILWWFVLIVTVASWVTCLGTIEYHCLASSFTYITGAFCLLVGSAFAHMSLSPLRYGPRTCSISKAHVTREYDTWRSYWRFK